MKKLMLVIVGMLFFMSAKPMDHGDRTFIDERTVTSETKISSDMFFQEVERMMLETGRNNLTRDELDEIFARIANIENRGRNQGVPQEEEN